MFTRFPFVIASSLLVVSCGSSNDKSSPDAHIIVTTDASHTTDGTVSTACQAAATYGAATVAGQTGEYDGSGSNEFIDVGGELNSNTKPDILDIQLFASTPPFTTNIVAGTYDLSVTSDTGVYEDCGACVRVLASFDGSAGSNVDPVGSYYQAKSGTLTITSVSPMVTGSVSNVVFFHDKYTNDGSGNFASDAPDPDDCASAITSASFSVTPTMGSGG